MRVSDVRIYVVPSGSRRPVIVEVMTDEGISGIGEAGVSYGLGGLAAANMIQELAERMVLGQDPSRIEQIWSAMYDHSFWAKGGGGAIVFSAISAIEHALWDIKGKSLGVPVYELLGGKFRDEVEVYANGWWDGCWTGDDYARAGERTVAEGYKALKCYPLAEPDPRTVLRHPSHRTVAPETLKLVVERIRALRKAVGPDIHIMLDLSGALSTDQTIRLCRSLEEFDILYVEEPADPFATGALKKISENIRIPIAVGERLYTRYEFHEALQLYAADILQPDLCNTGGIMEGKKIAALAELYNVRVAPHNCGSTLSTAVSLQLDACIPNFMTQEFFPYFQKEPAYVEILENPPEAMVKNGMLPIPTGPGLGVTLHAKNVAPHLWGRCSVA